MAVKTNIFNQLNLSALGRNFSNREAYTHTLGLFRALGLLPVWVKWGVKLNSLMAKIVMHLDATHYLGHVGAA